MKFSPKLPLRWAVTLAVACSAGVGAQAFAQGSTGPGDAEARAAVHQMSDFLAKQKSFTLKTASSIEVVLKNGQKLQFDQVAQIAVARPDKLRAIRVGAAAGSGPGPAQAGDGRRRQDRRRPHGRARPQSGGS